MLRKSSCTLSETLLIELEELHRCFKINKATFIRMAIYHGIEKLEQGYRPMRKKRNTIKRKYDIYLADDMWNRFDNLLIQIENEIEKSQKLLRKPNIEKTEDEKKQKIFYNDEYKLTRSEMIEAFLRIEIDKYATLRKPITKDIDSDDERLLDEHRQINISVEIPNILYDKMCDERDWTGLKETQLCKYYFTSALVNECQQKEFDTISTDADLMLQIEAVGLPVYKTLTLISNLSKSGKIIFRRDS